MDTIKGSKNSRIREALGRLYQEEGPYFQEYLRRFREDPTSRIFAPLAEAYRRMGRIDDAITICLEGLGHHPDFHGGRVALARCYLDKREFGLARHELEKIVSVVPENLLAQKLLGEACLALKDNANALRAFRMAQLLSPSDAALAQKIYELEQGQRYQAGGPAIDNKRKTAELLEQLAIDEARENGEPDAPAEPWANEIEQSLAPVIPPADSEKTTEVVPTKATRLEISDDFFQESPGLESLPTDWEPQNPEPVTKPNAAPNRVSAEVPLTPTNSEAVSPVVVKAEATDFNPIATGEKFEMAKAAAESWPALEPLDPQAAKEAMETWDDDERSDRIEALLGGEAKTEVEPFQIAHVSNAFEVTEPSCEITTTTLGDLYFAQGQFDKALQIFEKISAHRPSPEIEKKVQACRVKLGVDGEALARMRKIQALKGVLNKVKTSES